jgi:hypothetical protein
MAGYTFPCFANRTGADCRLGEQSFMHFPTEVFICELLHLYFFMYNESNTHINKLEKQSMPPLFAFTVTAIVAF